MSGFTSTSNLTHRAKVPANQFQGLIWGAVAVTLLFLIFRAIVRLKVFRQFFADDIFVLLSWLLFLANVILYQEMVETIYLTINVYAGLEAPPPDFLQRVIVFLHEELAVSLLFLGSLWSIKLSFLLFFKKLGHHVKRQNVLWWIVAAGTLVGFIICVGITEYRCTTTHDTGTLASCATPAAISRTHIQLQLTTAFDIITDVLILVLPVNLLWNVRISIRQKLALASIFSLTVFTMAVSLVRVVVLLGESDQIDISFLFTWFVVEQAVAIIIACVASYRALFTKETASQRLPDYRDRSDKRALNGPPYRREDSMSMENMKSVTVIDARSGHTDTSSPASSIDDILPAGGVHVRQDYSVYPLERSGL